MAKKTSKYIEQAESLDATNIRSNFRPANYKGTKAQYQEYKKNLVDYVQGLSKNLYDKTTRLVKAYKGNEASNPYLNSVKDRNVDAVVKRITRKQAEKMSVQELITKARVLTQKARNKTMSVREAKKFEKDFKAKFGKDYKDLTSADWAKIKEMEESGFDSTEAQDVYISIGEFITKDAYESKKAEELTDKDVQGIRDKISEINRDADWGNSPLLK